MLPAARIETPESTFPRLSDSSFLSSVFRLLPKSSQVSPNCLSGKSNMYMKMSVQHWCNDVGGGKHEDAKKKAGPVPLRPLKISETGMGSNLDLRGERPAKA